MEIQKERTNVEKFIDAWAVRQQILMMQQRALFNVTNDVLNISKRYGTRALADKAMELLGMERKDVAVMMDAYLGKGNAEELVRKGISLIRSGGYDPKMAVPKEVELKGKRNESLDAHLKIALAYVLRKEDITETERKAAMLLGVEEGNDLLANSCRTRILNSKMAEILHPDVHLEKKIVDKIKIKQILRNARL
jgi:hypothetical protein